MNETFQPSEKTAGSRIVVVDYGLGNLRSIVGAVERVGHPVLISDKATDIDAATKLILPGVGAFGDGMKNMQSRGLIDILTKAVIVDKKPILGICLGYQLFAKESYEFGHHAGLGWIDGSVVKLEPADASLRVPHVGWDDVAQVQSDVLFQGIPAHALFYFVHSYYMQCRSSSAVTGVCHYDAPIAVAYHHENIFGTQFHPEKSQLYGLMLLKNFLDL